FILTACLRLRHLLVFCAEFSRRTGCLGLALLLFAACVCMFLWQFFLPLVPAFTYFLLLFLISLRRWCLGFCNWVVQSPGTDGEGLPLEAAPLILSSESEPGVKFVCMYVCMYVKEDVVL